MNILKILSKKKKNSKKIKNKDIKRNLSQTKYKNFKKTTNKNKSVDKINNSSQYIEEKLNTNSDIDDNIDYDKKSENEPIIYHLINNKGDIYLYTIKSKTNNCIYLRCKDRKCLGKAVFKNNTLTVTEECNIKYDKHNYIQLKNPSDKIKSNNVTKEEMKLHLYQKAYFLYHYQNFRI